MPLTKKDALQYMDLRGRRVTAKELAIDLDSRASTASELLERMAAQGLVERDPEQRPREYGLTDVGRKRLAFLRAQDEDTPHSQALLVSRSRPDFGPQRTGRVASSLIEFDPVSSFASVSQQLDKLRSEVGQQLASVRESLHDLTDLLAVRLSNEGNPPALAERLRGLIRRAEALADSTHSNCSGGGAT